MDTCRYTRSGSARKLFIEYASQSQHVGAQGRSRTTWTGWGKAGRGDGCGLRATGACLP